MREAIDGQEESLGLQQSSKDRVTEFRPKKSLNLQFPDNIALFSGQFQQEQELLRNVEELSANVGLLPNAKKTMKIDVF